MTFSDSNPVTSRTWRNELSTLDPLRADRRLRLAAHLSAVCRELAKAKRETDKLGPPVVTTFRPWTDADREAWKRLMSEADEAKNQDGR